MIIIKEGGTPFDPNTLSKTERQIYDLKMKSPRDYHYESAEALKFELIVRNNIIEAAKLMDKAPVAFELFKKSKSNPKYWKRTDEGGFQLKKDAKPSEAIRDIFKNGKAYAFECATAMIIILYRAVLETIGDDAFNRLFADLYLMSWNHDNDLQLITEYGKKDTYPGDAMYFKNPDYSPKTPQWQGENVIKMPDDMYFGHGIGLKKADEMIAKLNKYRKPDSKVDAYLMDEASYPNFFELQKEVSGAGAANTGVMRWPAGAMVGRIGRRTHVFV